jgi:hypothetical protein
MEKKDAVPHCRYWNAERFCRLFIDWSESSVTELNGATRYGFEAAIVQTKRTRPASRLNNNISRVDFPRVRRFVGWEFARSVSQWQMKDGGENRATSVYSTETDFKWKEKYQVCVCMSTWDWLTVRDCRNLRGMTCLALSNSQPWNSIGNPPNTSGSSR